MIATLYQPFQHWSEGGSVYILSDLHFGDADCSLMDPDWVTPEEQVERINTMVKKNDTFLCLGDVGKADYVARIKAGKKILLTGNHDRKADYSDYFDEIYTGPLFIAEKILLSHEPVYGLPWCVNIHGHDHGNREAYREDCKHLNLAANVCGYRPVNLGKLIKDGILSDTPSIHRMTIDQAISNKKSDIEGALWQKKLPYMIYAASGTKEAAFRDFQSALEYVFTGGLQAAKGTKLYDFLENAWYTDEELKKML